MSVIAIRGFPLRASLKEVVKTLAKVINGHFEALSFKTPKNQPKLRPKIKTCYLRLSEKLDPVGVVEKVNSHSKLKLQLRASIPDNVPDLPLTSKHKLRITPKMQRAINRKEPDPSDKVLQLTTDEILIEVQAKYPGLFILSKKTGHKLLQEISKKIFNRVTDLVKSSPELGESCRQLSRAYRRAHPHFGDFQLMLSTLHAIEDAAGTPRSQLDEAELASTPTPQGVDNMPIEKVRQLCNRYSEKISKRLTEHINALPSETNQVDTEEEIAKKQVRVELKKLAPFISQIVHNVVQRQLLPKDGPHFRMRIYGEPVIPTRETMKPFLQRFKPVHVMRSTRMYNMLKFSVPPIHYHSVIAMNGTVLNGAKLTIRSSDMPMYKVNQECSDDEESPSADAAMDQDEDYGNMDL